jgi:tetratricopeptide (TPR) repeat protein
VAGLAAATLVAVVCLTAATVLLSAANRREKQARELAQQRGEDAERQAARARANFQMARDAVEEYCTKVSDDPRLKEKDLEGLRKELLQSAVKFHQKFVEQHGDDPALRADLGRAYLDLGLVVRYLDNKEAVPLFGKATAIYEELIAQHPAESSYPLQQAQAHIDLANALGTLGRTRESRAALERGLQTLESTRRQHGWSPLLQRLYLSGCYGLGHLLAEKFGAQAEAIAVLRKGVALVEDGHTVVQTADLPDLDLMTAVYSLLGVYLADNKKTRQEALDLCKKGIGLLQVRLTRTYRPATLLYGLCVAYSSLGRVQTNLSQFHGSVQTYRKAVELGQELVVAHPGVAYYLFALGSLYNNLAAAEEADGQVRQAFTTMKKALEAKEQLAVRHPGVPDYQANLVRSLANMALGTADQKQAWGYQQRAEKLASELNRSHPGVVQYQSALGLSIETRADLHRKANRAQEALAALDEVIALREQLVRTTDAALHRQVLTATYKRKATLALQAGKRDLAAEAFRKASALNPTDHNLLATSGAALLDAGRLDEALVALEKAVALKPNDALSRCTLGQCLLRHGRFVEGRAALQKGHELGRKQLLWMYPSRSWLRQADKLIKLDARLSAILAGKAQPADTRERLALAQFCQQYKQLNAASARFFAAAFNDPKRADDLKAQHRYNAACAAALAAAGQGKDASKLDDGERTRWRKQALDWLTADLALWTKQAEKGTPQARATVQKTLRHWQTDADLAGVRDEAALARLPAEEQPSWRKLWVEVARLAR